MDDQKFLFLFNAILLNASDEPYRQGRLLHRAVKHGHINMTQAKALWQKHHAIRGCTLESLDKAHDAYLSSLHPDPDEQLDQQWDEELTAPEDPFEQDPMDPCGAYDGER